MCSITVPDFIFLWVLRGLHYGGGHFAAKSDGHRKCGGRDFDQETDQKDRETRRAVAWPEIQFQRQEAKQPPKQRETERPSWNLPGTKPGR